MKLRWSHAVLYVRDLEAMIGFYRDMLGFQVSDRGTVGPPNSPFELAFLSQVGSDHHQLAFVPMRGEGPSTTLDHIAFRVDRLAEVQALARRLEEDGRASDLRPIAHGNAWSIYFRDPESNTIEVFCDSPFHVRQPQAVAWDLASSEAELRAWTEKQFGGEPEFGPIEEFYRERRSRFGD
jgi:catechol 2,3-dioxygenase